jgi:RNA polymerase sigma-70 factor (ECF subfamily)
MLARALGDIDRAEDAIGDAYVIALERWQRDGFPSNPTAWILTTARRRAIDLLRREKLGREKHDIAERLDARALERVDALPVDETRDIPDERLELIFACAHPSLLVEARIALILRTLGGLTTEEIASAFLAPVSTIAQRLVRSKRKIREAAIPFDVPPAHLLAERLDDVCTALYLIFNQGYVATSGSALARVDLCDEAIRLTHVLANLLPDEPEVLGLLSLMLLTHARREARTDALGALVTLEAQQRSRWDRPMMGAGGALLFRAAQYRRPGPYQIAAAIASAHCYAATAADTNWTEIAWLYEQLYALRPTPVVALNRAVAIGFARTAADGLVELAALAGDGRLDGYYPYHVARAELSLRAGDGTTARAAFGRALELTRNEAERAFLRRRLAAIEDRPAAAAEEAAGSGRGGGDPDEPHAAAVANAPTAQTPGAPT